MLKGVTHPDSVPRLDWWRGGELSVARRASGVVSKVTTAFWVVLPLAHRYDLPEHRHDKRRAGSTSITRISSSELRDISRHTVRCFNLSPDHAFTALAVPGLIPSTEMSAAKAVH
jgi:hypothetical protein